MIFTDPSIRSNFEPLHIILDGVLHADRLIAAVDDRHKVLPSQTILKRTATSAVGSRAEPGKRIPPDALFDVLHTDDRHARLGENELIRVLHISQSQPCVVSYFPVETPTTPVHMLGLRLGKQGLDRPEDTEHD